ncbi:hypothetical protein FAM09_24875 [Niastella caeni]|uniref:Uncharacterized protein n=1 Tax=Niastella caeni TaxID=2569763 RepID=A0A4V4GZW7_9BACT|nr:hypothetical protein [Niastella caeni]THU34256.1 hypothetical protein FAM09_24875 [Niastella caeni]
MDFGLQIKGEFLDLFPNTILELEEENPFLQLTNEVQGQYSLPLSIPLTEKNMRLLGYPNLLNVKKSTVGIETVCITNGLQHSRGQIKLESGQSNLNASGRGSISVYYLFGVSDFYKFVENKSLADCDYGSDISFPWHGTNVYSGNGFWAHVTTVMNSSPGTFDYAIFPIINAGGLTRYQAQGPCILNFGGSITSGDGSANNPYVLPGNYTLDLSWVNFRLGWRNEICPFPYLKFVIQKLFSTFGWSVQGSVLNDPDFLKIVLLHNKIIDYVGPSVAALNGSSQFVVWNMKNHVPRVKIGTFLLALSNRFGWWLDFDYRKKIVTIRHRNNVVAVRTQRNVIPAATYNFKVNSEAKIYSIKQASGSGEKIDVTNLQGIVNNRHNLPTAGEGVENQMFFVLSENAYYRCVSDENIFTWEKSADNTFDYIQKDQTDEIITNCLVPESYFDLLRDIGRNSLNRNITVPYINIFPGESETDTFYVAYNFGLKDSYNSNGQPDYKYPMASAGCYDNKGNLITSTALVFEFNDATTDYGLFIKNWSFFLTFLQQREEITIQMPFTVAELLNINYTQTILIRNAEYFIKNPHFRLPLKGFVNMELIRI